MERGVGVLLLIVVGVFFGRGRLGAWVLERVRALVVAVPDWMVGMEHPLEVV